jgi:hypothetical protein
MKRPQPITAAILAHETWHLIHKQIRPDDPRFMSTQETIYDRDHLCDTLDGFNARYLEEMADTAVNRHWPVEKLPRLELPLCTPCAIRERQGLTVRLVMAYDVWWDVDRLRIDVTWEPQQ